MSDLKSNTKYILIALMLFASFNFIVAQNDLRWKEPENLVNLNSVEDDFAPSWNKYENLLYFNSVNLGTSLFYCIKNVSDDTPFLAKGDINKKNDNRSYICFESEGKAYLTSFRKFKSRSYQNIFEARKDKNGWTAPFPVDSLKTESFSGHTTISPDRSIMVFSSNRQSGRNDADLWIAYNMENGTWGNARQLSSLNSNGNEVTPFLASEDTLYFSSNGQGGQGGYDIFISVNVMGVWQNPFPVNSINTRFDESDFVILPDGKAVFASDRPGGKGKLDLYIASAEEQKSPIVKSQSEMEIDIAAQVTTVRTNLELKYNYYPVSTTLFSNFYSFNELSRYIPLIEAQVTPNPDSIYLYSPGIIGLRLRNNPSANIKIVLYTGSKSENDLNNIRMTADSLIVFLALNFGIAKSRIEIIENNKTIESIVNGSQILLEITSDNVDILKPMELGELNIEIDPPVIQASIMARPEKEFRNYKCELYLNDFKTGFNIERNDISDPIYINLDEYKISLTSADSIVLKVTAWDRYSNIVRESMNINTVYSESKSLLPQKSKSGLSEEYYIFLNGNTEYFDSPAFANITENLKEACKSARSMKIVYFESGNNTQIEQTQLLAGVLDEKTGGVCKFDVVYSNETEKFITSSRLKSSIIKLIIQK